MKEQHVEDPSLSLSYADILKAHLAEFSLSDIQRFSGFGQHGVAGQSGVLHGKGLAICQYSRVMAGDFWDL